MKILDKQITTLARSNFTTRESVNSFHSPITIDHFSHVSCQNLVPEESGPRFAWHTY